MATLFVKKTTLVVFATVHLTGDCVEGGDELLAASLNAQSGVLACGARAAFMSVHVAVLLGQETEQGAIKQLEETVGDAVRHIPGHPSFALVPGLGQSPRGGALWHWFRPIYAAPGVQGATERPYTVELRGIPEEVLCCMVQAKLQLRTASALSCNLWAAVRGDLWAIRGRAGACDGFAVQVMELQSHEGHLELQVCLRTSVVRVVPVDTQALCPGATVKLGHALARDVSKLPDSETVVSMLPQVRAQAHTPEAPKRPTPHAPLPFHHRCKLCVCCAWSRAAFPCTASELKLNSSIAPAKPFRAARLHSWLLMKYRCVVGFKRPQRSPQQCRLNSAGSRAGWDWSVLRDLSTPWRPFARQRACEGRPCWAIWRGCLRALWPSYTSAWALPAACRKLAQRERQVCPFPCFPAPRIARTASIWNLTQRLPHLLGRHKPL